MIASAKNLPIMILVLYPASVALHYFPLFAAGRKVALRESLLVGVGVTLWLGFGLGGGLAVLQHAILRFLLSRQGHIPRNYAQFLRYTTERRLTQQIGGRFRFLHRELLDHFAAMEVESSKST